MVMRAAFALLILLAGCQRAEAPANQAAPAAPPAAAPAPEGDIGAAERLVRQRIGTGGEVHFADAQRRAANGVPIVCGAYQQGGARHRYIVVAGDQAFVEPQMRGGEMERAWSEYCTDGERG
jgi:hypothetical protein